MRRSATSSSRLVRFASGIYASRETAARHSHLDLEREQAGEASAHCSAPDREPKKRTLPFTHFHLGGAPSGKAREASFQSWSRSMDRRGIRPSSYSGSAFHKFGRTRSQAHSIATARHRRCFPGGDGFSLWADACDGRCAASRMQVASDTFEQLSVRSVFCHVEQHSSRKKCSNL